MPIKTGDAVRFYDDETKMDQTGKVLEIKPGIGKQRPVCLIKWDDGFPDSWVGLSELTELNIGDKP